MKFRRSVAQDQRGARGSDAMETSVWQRRKKEGSQNQARTEAIDPPSARLVERRRKKGSRVGALDRRMEDGGPLSVLEGGAASLR